MKKLGALLFLSLYFFTMLHPFLPHLEYAINYDYIVEFLCINKDKPQLVCYGNCHLKNQLKEANKEKTSTESNPKAAVERTKISEALLAIINLNLLQDEKTSKQLILFEKSLNQYFIDIPTPPPKSFY